jgi:hypothetical protein
MAERLHAAGLRVLPSIANITDGKWAYQPVGPMLHSPALMARQVAAIVALVQRHDYAGVDIDYENLHAGDRQAFSTFVRDLAAAPHAHGKLLPVAVFAKTSNAGTDPRNVAQDYAAIGRVADQVRLMGYDYHWATSPPGPIAPVGWIRAVLRYAKTQIPASKIILGIPLYGELITSSVLFFLLPLALLVLLVPDLAGQVLSWPAFGELHLAVSTHLTLTAVLFGVVLPDLLITCAVAVLERQPRLLLLAVCFPFMRMLDAAISLYSVPAAGLSVSNGRWKSPARRPVGGATTASLPAAGIPARGGYHAGTSDEPGRPARVAEASHVSG